MDKNFIFWSDWKYMLDTLPDATRLIAYESIVAYGLTGEDYTGSDLTIKAIMALVKGTIDRNKNDYESRCVKNRENGKLGGRPKKPKETEQNPVKPNGFDVNQSQAKKADNDIDIDNDIEIDIDKDNDISTTITSIREQLIKNNSMWIEAICMKHSITKDQLNDKIGQFATSCVARGSANHSSQKEAMAHFDSWLSVTMQAERKGNKQDIRNSNIDAGIRAEMELRERLGVK